VLTTLNHGQNRGVTISLNHPLKAVSTAVPQTLPLGPVSTQCQATPIWHLSPSLYINRNGQSKLAVLPMKGGPFQQNPLPVVLSPTNCSFPAERDDDVTPVDGRHPNTFEELTGNIKSLEDGR